MSVKLDLGFMTFDLREVPAYARRAEELGVDALWSAETKHDPFLPLAVAAANDGARGFSQRPFAQIARHHTRIDV